jgi:hypothetical protein
MSHVFISYSRRNIDYALQLVEDMKSRQFNAWIDKEDIDTGEEWRKVLKEAVKNCGAFVFIVSPDSNTSEWCLEELQWATKLGKPILPLLLKPIEKESASELVSTLIDKKQYEDVTGDNLPRENFYKVLSKSVYQHIPLNKQDRISNLDLLRTDGLYVYAPDLEYENMYPSECTNYIYVQFIDRLNLKFFISSRFDIFHAVQVLEKSKNNPLVIRQNYLLFRHLLNFIINVYEDEIVISNDFTSMMPTSLPPFTADITCVGIYKFHSFE